MIRTRFGETMPMATDNMTPITPYEHTQRPLRQISDIGTYRKVHSTLPAAMLSALRSRVKHGNPKEISRLWHRRDMTFLALDFEWSEKSLVVLEMGYAAIRSQHLEASGIWPPIPDSNYRKGHYIVQDYVDKVHNRLAPTFPWDYAWGDSQIVTKAKLPEILQALLTSLATPDSESVANTLALVTHTPQGILERLQELKVKLPSNVLVIDIAQLERQIYINRKDSSPTPGMLGPQMRSSNQTLPLPLLVASLNIPCISPFNNSGNDAFYTLLSFQYLVDPEGTRIPPPKASKREGFPMVASMPNMAMGMGAMGMMNPMLDPMAMVNSFGALNGTGSSPEGSVKPRHMKRMSGGTEEFGVTPSWQQRLSMMNGSMPSLAAATGVASAGGPGSSRGRASAAPGGSTPSGGSGERRSGSMPRTGGGKAGGSGSSSPRLPPDVAARSSSNNSRPKIRTPNSSSSSNGHQLQQQQRQSVMHRRNASDDTDDSDDFQPPQAPFAREGFKTMPGRNRSYDDHSHSSHSHSTHQSHTLNPPLRTQRTLSHPSRPTYQHQNSGSQSSTPTSSGSANPSVSITVTDHGDARRPIPRTGPIARSAQGHNEVSLNDPKEKRPHSEVMQTTTAKTRERGNSAGGFLASTFKRFSMKP
ncbi:hypothetical protein FRB99_005331 [Tulasnella sp. 403]|nr:hypothetical protein FRB99_005331 [Tulasnella sp. 403]